jgi:hypothetical protein
MNSTTPVSPEDRRSSDAQGMQKHADLARLCRGVAIPLALPTRAVRGDNCECWLRTPRAGCYRLARALLVWEQLLVVGTDASSHLVGAQNPGPRSGQLSRAGPREEEHNLREEPCVVMQVEELAQTRSSSWDRDEADGLTPSGGSTPIGKPVDSTPVRHPRMTTPSVGIDFLIFI